MKKLMKNSQLSALLGIVLCFIAVLVAQQPAASSGRLPLIYNSTDSRRDFTMPRSIAMMSSSGTCATPFGREAISVSFSRAMIIRKVEVRGASPAFIEAFI